MRTFGDFLLLLISGVCLIIGIPLMAIGSMLTVFGTKLASGVKDEQ